MRREGQAMQGCIKRVCTEFCKDAKQYKHTQTLTLRKLGSVRCFGSGGSNGDVGGAPSVRFRVKAYYMSGKTALYGNYGSVSGKTAAK